MQQGIEEKSRQVLLPPSHERVYCTRPPVTRWWGYLIVIGVFALAAAVWIALLYAERRVWPTTAAVALLRAKYISAKRGNTVAAVL